MKIGTDVSLKTCWQEGYLTMEFKVRELFPNGRKNGLDKGCTVRFRKSDGGAMKMGISGITKILDVGCDFDWLMELYNRHKDDIDSMCGYDALNPRPDDLENPDEHVMLNLANDVDHYCGLQ